MKTHTLSFIVILATFVSLNAEDKLSSDRSETEKEQIRVINKRLNYGDKQSITEVATMRPGIAFPFLAYYTLDRSTDPERAEIARAALSKMPGLEDYYRPILTVPAKESFEAYNKRIDAFDVLSLLRTKEAIRLVASFLFDESVSNAQLPDDMLRPGPVKTHAALSLARMRLPGAPTGPGYDPEGVEKWREWWKKHRAEYEK